MIIFSLSTISERFENLDCIIPTILSQCDLLFVSLINYDYIPSILENEKIRINRFESAGSEIRFYNYNDIPDDSYYFTIDDDILYPVDYTKVMMKNMILYENKVSCCVHGSNIDKNLNDGFYKKNRQVYHFTEGLSNNSEVMIPGVGTSCFYKGNMNIDIERYRVRNMSDTYTGCFLSEQNVKRISISRNENWLVPLNEFGTRIFGNNPHDEIDRMIFEYKNIL
jgi:hypothetical protein